MAAALCPWCSAPRADGPNCPRCGANYAKAALIRTQGRAITPVAVVKEPEAAIVIPAHALEEPAVEDPALEWWFCVAALPAALALGVLFHWLTPGLQRIFFGMPVHELGHAVTGWLCGFFAIPTPLWKTIMPESRGLLAPVILAGAIFFGLYRAWLGEKWLYVALLAALLVVQAFGTFVISEETATMLIVFGGDGMGMVIGGALMAAFFFGKRSGHYKGALRWGFLVIGAAGFVDTFATWWTAQWDVDVIPFGEIEGTGLSDPMRLLEDYGWSTKTLVRRYVAVGAATLAAIVAVYAWGVKRAAGKKATG